MIILQHNTYVTKHGGCKEERNVHKSVSYETQHGMCYKFHRNYRFCIWSKWFSHFRNTHVDQKVILVLCKYCVCACMRAHTSTFHTTTGLIRILNLWNTMQIRMVGIKQPLHNDCLQSAKHPFYRPQTVQQFCSLNDAQLSVIFLSHTKWPHISN
jgi:hypothetical protein